MIPIDTLRELYDYNYWARDRQLEACAALTEEQFLRPMGSSFSSVRDTLAHLVAVEWIWHERWRGRSPNQLDARAFAAETFPNLTAIRERWQAIEGNVREYLAGLDEPALKQPLTYTNMKGETWTYPLWQTLLHVVNHQTYQRGQITTLLRQLGAEASAIDYLVMQDSGGVAKAQSG
ncbi:MAG: DinB family protein [Terriglobia bacterium]